MSDQTDQESIQQSFPSTSIPGSFNQKETETTLPSSIDSLLNNDDDSSSVINNSLINDETNSFKQETKRTRSRKTNSRPIRNKIVKESSTKNEPYTVPHSIRSQIQQNHQQDSNIMDSNTSESINTDTMNSIVPITERKKYCAKCKESANIAKIINSKMGRIEELVKDLKKVTDDFRQNNTFSQPLLSSAITTKPSFKKIDFSRMSISDLQNFVMVVTNTIMTTKSPNSTSTVKSEFEESKFLKIETSQ
ncbi:hypothetical protein C1645_738285 [Glomus cerebriforme]|uniref:Uncharacterized protein n=1 Tax=Glomus cerebriforme TaxID=658196 RepID=A0A397SUR2_9GLOM|nr:hypothetical protein C1645_738285 [Glomus cerebriforme]